MQELLGEIHDCDVRADSGTETRSESVPSGGSDNARAGPKRMPATMLPRPRLPVVIVQKEE